MAAACKRLPQASSTIPAGDVPGPRCCVSWAQVLCRGKKAIALSEDHKPGLPEEQQRRASALASRLTAFNSVLAMVSELTFKE